MVSRVLIGSTAGYGMSPLQSALPSMGMARGGCHTWRVTTSSQEHAGTMPRRSPRHTAISPVLPRSQEEPVRLSGL